MGIGDGHYLRKIVDILEEKGFEIEGLLREPYKSGVDNVFFGKLI